MSDSMQKIQTITQLFCKILAICYFGKFWACSDISDHTQQKRYNQFLAFFNVWLFIYIIHIFPKLLTTIHIFPELLTIHYFGALWACLDMPENTQHKWQFVAFIYVWLYAKYQDNPSTSSWAIENLFQSTLGMPRDEWQHPTKMA